MCNLNPSRYRAHIFRRSLQGYLSPDLILEASLLQFRHLGTEDVEFRFDITMYAQIDSVSMVSTMSTISQHFYWFLRVNLV